jgi:hypothetical protein
VSQQQLHDLDTRQGIGGLAFRQSCPIFISGFHNRIESCAAAGIDDVWIRIVIQQELCEAVLLIEDGYSQCGRAVHISIVEVDPFIDHYLRRLRNALARCIQEGRKSATCHRAHGRRGT